jgi:DedD protein
VAPPAQEATTRYIVQVGAFADPVAARQVRLKVEQLGFVTYTHVIDVPGGQRIRVRVGPMTDRAQAQRTLEKIKQAGLSGALLTL